MCKLRVKFITVCRRNDQIVDFFEENTKLEMNLNQSVYAISNLISIKTSNNRNKENLIQQKYEVPCWVLCI